MFHLLIKHMKIILKTLISWFVSVCVNICRKFYSLCKFKIMLTTVIANISPIIVCAQVAPTTQFFPPTGILLARTLRVSVLRNLLSQQLANSSDCEGEMYILIVCLWHFTKHLRTL